MASSARTMLPFVNALPIGDAMTCEARMMPRTACARFGEARPSLMTTPEDAAYASD